MSTERIGYRVIEQIPRVEPDLLARAARYSAPELCDGEIVYNAMDYHIKPMVTQKKIVGQAVTLKLTLGDSLMVTKAMSVCRPGDVRLIDGRGSGNNAVWGDQRSLTAKLLGLGGVVIDGAFRDIDGNEEIGFPIYARAVTCGCSTKNSHGEVNVPISCGGVAVHPGDIIVGDRNGVVVVPLAFAEQIIASAQEKAERVERLKAEIRASGKVIPDSFAEKLAKLGY